MKLYELVDVYPVDVYPVFKAMELSEDWKTRIGRKGYFVGEVGEGLCLMFSYRLQNDFWGFISSPIHRVEGKVNETDIVAVSMSGIVYKFVIAETSED